MIRRIVFIDDNPDFLDLVEQELRSDSFQIITILDKREKDLLAAIREASPDMIFLDVYLTSTETSELCSLLKSKDETKNVPLYLISFSDKSDTDRIAATVNADGAFSKPLSKEQILELLQKHFPA
ncbi:MAG: response regulator [Candidatus Omnitrophica bacterium]|nr:response regulator [Candidatus Omnitrophota bacterium]